MTQQQKERVEKIVESVGNRHIRFIKDLKFNTLYDLIYYTCNNTRLSKEYLHDKESKICGIKNPKAYYKQYIGYSRSLEDMYMITRYYFPEASIYEILKELGQIAKVRRLDIGYCFTFRKYMYSHFAGRGGGYTDPHGVLS